MVFSSIVFLCLFLPVVLILHTVIPDRRVKNGLLIVASLLFYAYGEPLYVIIMVASSICNYLFALLLSKKKSKAILILAVIVNIGVLGVFKYSGFIVENINSLSGLSIHVPEITLPIGISFFTFQALSYVIDVYREEVTAQKNYFRVLLYISFFPQLIAGPIVRYKDIEQDIENRPKATADEIALGMRRFIVGLGKKVIISNTMGLAADYFFNAGPANINIVGAWIAAIAYLMQIYFDFSGYSDMAIGLGGMLGFHIKENFDHPYTAVTVQDFWRRWHISLSSWFRDYVYIPLGGNRKGKARTIINRFIIFFLVGLWHGANWTFIVWGLFHGLFLLFEATVPVSKLPKIITRIYTLLVVTVGFVIFRADSLKDAAGFIAKMFSGTDFSAAATSFNMQMLTPFFFFALCMAILSCGTLNKLTTWVSSLSSKETLTGKERLVLTTTFILSWLLLAWCIIRLAGSNYNPFIYFRF